MRGGRGEKWRGPREEAAAAGSGSADGAAKTAQTGKTKRQSSERFMDGRGRASGARQGRSRVNRWRGWQGNQSGGERQRPRAGAEGGGGSRRWEGF